MEILLDASLEPQRIKTQRELFPDAIRKCFYGGVVHENYLEYLSLAWGNHYGIVFSPDIAWYIILTEIANEIKANPEQYKSLFTTSDDKQEISVPTADPQLISLDAIMERLKELVPTDTELFLPKFTTSTDTSELAFIAAFADAVSPYYNYSMFCCGIPKVKVLGESRDWEMIVGNLFRLRDLLFPLANYFNKLLDVINEIRVTLLTNVDADVFWKSIFELERCGSGGQTEVKGWIEKFFVKEPRVKYVSNYPSMIAVVPYKNLTTDQDFELKYGLLSSSIEDGYLIPDFGYVINSKN